MRRCWCWQLAHQKRLRHHFCFNFGRPFPMTRHQDGKLSNFADGTFLFRHGTSKFHGQTSFLRHGTCLVAHGTSKFGDRIDLVAYVTCLVGRGTSKFCHGTCFIHNQTSRLHRGTCLAGGGTSKFGGGISRFAKELDGNDDVTLAVEKLALGMLNGFPRIKSHVG